MSESESGVTEQDTGLEGKVHEDQIGAMFGMGLTGLIVGVGISNFLYHITGYTPGGLLITVGLTALAGVTFWHSYNRVPAALTIWAHVEERMQE